MRREVATPGSHSVRALSLIVIVIVIVIVNVHASSVTRARCNTPWSFVSSCVSRSVASDGCAHVYDIAYMVLLLVSA